MYIIVVGCGRVGSQLAEFLAMEGHDVVVIDENKASFRRLGAAFNGVTIEGVGFDEEVLKEAGVEKADALAAVTNFDNTNAMIAEVATKLFNVPRAVARLYNPERERTYQKLGIDYVCGTTIVAERMLDKIIGAELTSLSAEDNLRIVRFEISSKFYGKKVLGLEKPEEIRVVAVIRKEEGLIEHDNLLFEEGDEVIVATKGEALEEVRKMVKRQGA